MMILNSVLCNAQAERAKEELPLKLDPNGHRKVPIVIDRSKKPSEVTEIAEGKNTTYHKRIRRHHKKVKVSS